MKKILLFLSFLLMSIWAFGQGTETFENITNSNGTSYTSRSWTGDNGQASWAATNARIDQKITGNRGLCFKASTSSSITMKLTTAQQTAGIGTLSFNYKFPYSDSGKNRVLSVTIGDNTYSSGTLSYNSNSSNSGSIPINTALTSNTITINVNNGGARICIDDFSWTSNSSPSYTITAQSNNNSYGTVSLDGSVITGVPANGCRYASPAYSVSPANSATVSQNGNEFTVTPSANTTVTINFEQIPTYTITYDSLGTTIGTETCVSATLPTLQTSSVCALLGWSFAGWSGKNTNITQSDILTGEFTPAKDTTLYAVYSQVVSETFIFSDIASANNWENGIAYTEVTQGNVTIEALGGGNNGKWYNSGGGSWRMYSGGEVSISATSNIISVTSTPSCEFTITNGVASFYPSARTDFTTITVNYGNSEYATTLNCSLTTYTVTYDKNDDEASSTMTDSNSPYIDGSTVTVLGNQFTNSNACKEFVNWNTSPNGNGTDYDADDTFTIGSDVTLYAQWSTNEKYTVSFNTGDQSQTQSTCGASVTLPTPTVSSACSAMGWEFAGWSENSSSYSNLKMGSYIPTSDITLYAVFKNSDESGDGFKLSLTFSENEYYVAPRSGTNKYFNVTTDEAEAEVFYTDNDTLYIYESDTKTYVSSKANSTSLSFDTSDPTAWTIAESDDLWTFTSKGTGSRNLAWNYNQGSPRFSSYSGSDTYLFHFTKHAVGSTEYSFNPTCETVHPDTVILAVDTITLYIGETEILTPTVLPTNSSNKNVSWLSLDETIATVTNGTVTAIAEGTTVAAIQTEDGNKVAYCVVIVLGNPDIEVVEWGTDFVKIDISNFDAASATLEDQNTQAEIEENVADELFFSKYFEAESSIKMLGIYNGTRDSIDLSLYSIKAAAGTKKTSWDNTYDLSNLGWIHSAEEIVLYSYGNDASTIVGCIGELNFSDYIRVLDNGIVDGSLTFNGDDAIGLFKNTELIDIIGAGNTSAPNVDGLKGKSNGKDTTMYETHLIDNYCWIVDTADNSNGYSNVIGTDLCLLIRKSSVHSGRNAVLKDTVDFVTLADEWIGKPVVKKDSSTCKNFKYVGTFDYNEHYFQYEVIYPEQSITNSKEGDYYKLDIDLSDLACTNLKITVKDSESNTVSETVKVPIMISENTTTKSSFFNKKDCDECDVIILSGKTLTVNGTASKNRLVKLYEGSNLIIPVDSAYTIKLLSLRRDQDSVSNLLINGNLTVEENLYFDLSLTSDKWYYVVLPDTFTPGNVKFVDGKTPDYGTDYLIKYYDGQERALKGKGGWKIASINKKFAPGIGFIIALSDIYTSKEFRIELNKDRITSEQSDKTVNGLRAWPAKAANDIGWNLIGNPFMSYYNSDLTGDITLGQLTEDDNHHWLYEGDVRYAIIPSTAEKDKIAGGFASVLLSDRKLKPFEAFFVQIGGDSVAAHNLNFSAARRVNRIVARNTEQKEIFLRINVGEYKTGCFISDKFTDEYEPGDDLESNYPVYQLVNNYKLLYSAINDSILEKGITVYSNGGEISLELKTNINEFESIYINQENNWYDLLHGDNVIILPGSFKLFAKRKQDVTTDLEMIPTKGIYKFTDGKQVYINRNNLIFTIFGNLIQ